MSDEVLEQEAQEVVEEVTAEEEAEKLPEAGEATE